MTHSNKQQYFVYDRLPENSIAPPNFNLNEPRFRGRYSVSSQSIRDYCKREGTYLDASLRDAKKIKFIYEIGTSGPGVSWLGGLGTGRVLLFDVLQLNRPIIMKALQERRAILHIDQGWEGFPLIENAAPPGDGLPEDYADMLYSGIVTNPRNHYDVIYGSCEAYNIMPSQIIITTSNLKEKQIHDKHYSDRDSKLKIVSSIPLCGLLKKLNDKDAISFNTQIEYKSTAKELKSFSCLNRVTRQHRLALGLMLNYNKLLDPKICDFSHSSRLGGHPGLSTQPISSRHAVPYNWDSHPAFNQNNVEDFIGKLPYVLDQKDFNQNHVWTMFKQTYLNSWFSLITESAYNEEHQTSCFVSEKVFKPMLCHQPFVVAGHPDTLTYLKKLGFKTFDKWWDESYDYITNPTDRMQAIVDLCIHLVNKTNTEWLAIYKDMQEVLEHNYNHLEYMKYTDYSEVLKNV